MSTTHQIPDLGAATLSDSTVENTLELQIVHALRVQGFVEAGTVVEATGLAVDEVVAVLHGLADLGFVRHREGRISGWALPSEGRAYGESLLASELESAGCRKGVEEAYRRFLAVNASFLGLCTDWQLRPDPDDPDGQTVVNDHADNEWDNAVIERLVEVDGIVGPICDDLTELLTRFHGYRHRFTAALERVRAGEADWFARPIIDSYHTIWFQLHENLLATLGIDRASEHDS